MFLQIEKMIVTIFYIYNVYRIYFSVSFNFNI